ncbi:MAG: hypothetical protein O7B35_10275 [Deltaproteobacteria bacterium]|nr:hypothetical protein [Deltaproteobacteria bacterium]
MNELSERLLSLWFGYRERFYSLGSGSIDQKRIQEAASAGGIYEGHTIHDELYFDFTDAQTDYALHLGGKSFRVRATLGKYSDSTEFARVLMVLSAYPVKPVDLGALDPRAYWKGLDSHHGADFESLTSDLEGLVRFCALPSVVECLVVFPTNVKKTRDLLTSLSQRIDYGGFRPIAQQRKSSVKLALRPWQQNPVTGRMETDWAYIVLDEISTTTDAGLASKLSSWAPRWSSFYQVELELGPWSDSIPLATDLLDSTQQTLEAMGVRSTVVFGRKIHRLLLDAGISMG